MRAFSPTMILCLATLSAWPAIAQAQMQMPGMCQIESGQPMMMPGSGMCMPVNACMPQPQCMPQGQCMPQAQCMPQGQCMAPGAYMDRGACAGQGLCRGRMGIFDCPCDGGVCGPRFTFTGEAIALQRSTTRSQGLVRNDNGATLLNSKEMDFPMAFGPKVSAIWHDPCDIGLDLEVAYFQVDGFETDASVPGSSLLLVTDMNIPRAPHVTDVFSRYTSALYNGEVNVRQEWCDGLTLLCGFRMVQLNEHYDASSMSDDATPLPVLSNVRVSNHLYGFQIGADAEVYNMCGPLTVNALCKAGIYQNYAHQSISRTYGTTALLDAERDHAAFLGEVGVVARYAITCHVAFRACYEAMWLEGVALAPEQIGANSFLTGSNPLIVNCNSNGGVFYHGGSLGVECRF